MNNTAINFLYETVKKFPEKPCIVDKKELLSFHQFFSKAAAVASILKQAGMMNQPVLIFLPKSASAVISFAGVLMSGNFYVPVDIKAPLARLRKILEHLAPILVITRREYHKAIHDLSIPNEKILFLEDALKNAKNYPISELIVYNKATSDQIIDLDPCYVMHTSGSTGVPKGVVISHRGVIDYINWAATLFDIKEKEIIGNQAPLFFDNSTLDIYLSWATGALVHLIPEEILLFPAKLIEYLENHQITLIFFVPSLLVNISKLNLLSPGRLPFLKKIIFAGEVMPTKHLAYWQRNLPGRFYANLYGPTEIAVDCTYFIVDRIYEQNENLPIGFPRNNSGIIILNKNNEIAYLNEIGEICVRGSSLALGYWNDKATTKKVFVQNPTQNKYSDIIYRTGDLAYKNERGEIMFVGRLDSQIKHMGYRIELGEIEAAALTVSAIISCCVLYNEKKQEITLFYEAKKQMPSAELRKKLVQNLPSYMLPRKIYYLKNMPLNQAGKIDKKFLRNKFFKD
jgi:amino acid adenylation domain-containing protein